MKFVIVILMLFSEFDSEPKIVEVTELDEKPLYFNTAEECFDHVVTNYTELVGVGLTTFPEAIDIEAIRCMRKAITWKSA